MKKLAGVEAPLANFFASGVLALGAKLGPGAVAAAAQPRLRPGAAGRFFAQLPRSTGAAAELAARHDERMDGRALLTTAADRPLRHALEVRHDSFETAGFVELLRAHDVALVVADTAGRWPALLDVTSDHVYIRLHGEEELYVSGYDPPALDRWAARIRTWAAGGTPDRRHRAGAARPRGSPGTWSSTSTTTSRSGRRSTRSSSPTGSGSRRPPIRDRPVGRHRDVDEQARTDWPEIARSARGPRAAARARRRAGTDQGPVDRQLRTAPRDRQLRARHRVTVRCGRGAGSRRARARTRSPCAAARSSPARRPRRRSGRGRRRPGRRAAPVPRTPPRTRTAQPGR